VYEEGEERAKGKITTDVRSVTSRFREGIRDLKVSAPFTVTTTRSMGGKVASMSDMPNAELSNL